MASNELPRDRNKLYVLCDSMLAGLGMYGVALGVAQNTAAKLSPLLQVTDVSGNLVLPPVAGTGARNWELAFGNAKAGKKTAATAVRASGASHRSTVLPRLCPDRAAMWSGVSRLRSSTSPSTLAPSSTSRHTASTLAGPCGRGTRWIRVPRMVPGSGAWFRLLWRQ